MDRAKHAGDSDTVGQNVSDETVEKGRRLQLANHLQTNRTLTVAVAE
jgi:hypothetical protein